MNDKKKMNSNWKKIIKNLTLSPIGGLLRPPRSSHHFFDYSGTVIARTLKIFDLSQNRVEEMLNKIDGRRFFSVYQKVLI